MVVSRLSTAWEQYSHDFFMGYGFNPVAVRRPVGFFNGVNAFTNFTKYTPRTEDAGIYLKTIFCHHFFFLGTSIILREKNIFQLFASEFYNLLN